MPQLCIVEPGRASGHHAEDPEVLAVQFLPLSLNLLSMVCPFRCGWPQTLPSRLKTFHWYFFRTFLLCLGPNTSEVNDKMALISAFTKTAQQRRGPRP